MAALRSSMVLSSISSVLAGMCDVCLWSPSSHTWLCPEPWGGELLLASLLLLLLLLLAVLTSENQQVLPA
jgi:hypothetical protein